MRASISDLLNYSDSANHTQALRAGLIVARRVFLKSYIAFGDEGANLRDTVPVCAVFFTNFSKIADYLLQPVTVLHGSKVNAR